MASLMDGDSTLFVRCHHFGFLLQSANDAIDGIEEVLIAHFLLVMAGRYQGSLIADIGNIGTRESRRLTRQEVQVDILVKLQRLHVYLEDSLALRQIGQINTYLKVEASRTKQRLVKHIHTVGSRKDDHARIAAEAIHLREQGIERILALVIAAHSRIFGACSSHGIDLVDEDNTGSLLLGLLEDIADTTCAHADKHLDKVGTTHREERHCRFACHGLGQQGLTGSRRTNEEGSLRNLATHIGIPLRILEKLYDFLHLLFGSFLTCHVLEGDIQFVSLLIELGFRLTDVKDATSTSSAATHPAHR